MARMKISEGLQPAGSAPAAAPTVKHGAADSKGLEWERTFKSRQKWAFLCFVEAVVRACLSAPN
jgi:hypothetical protein